jgi:hypothetical protein
VVLTPSRRCQVDGGNSIGDGGNRAGLAGESTYKP